MDQGSWRRFLDDFWYWLESEWKHPLENYPKGKNMISDLYQKQSWLIRGNDLSKFLFSFMSWGFRFEIPDTLSLRIMLNFLLRFSYEGFEKFRVFICWIIFRWALRIGLWLIASYASSGRLSLLLLVYNFLSRLLTVYIWILKKITFFIWVL